MKTVDTKSLTGRALDWAIAKIIDREDLAQQILDRPESYAFRPSTEWLAGGPLIEVYKVNLQEHSIESLGWLASIYQEDFEPAQARDIQPLVAVCRAIAIKVYGPTALIPDGLLAETEKETVFTNYYKCSNCGHEWSDTWTATCDDDCPECGARHISPVRSDDL